MNKKEQQYASEHRATEIVTESRIGWRSNLVQKFKEFLKSKNSYFILVICFLAIISPFSYMAVPFQMPGWFGYTYMKGFLWQMGFPFSTMMVGIIVNFYSKKMNEGKDFMLLFSKIILLIGSFFFVMGFYQMSRKLDLRVYYSIVLATAILSVSILLFISNQMRRIENTLRDKEKVKQLVRNLFSFISKNVREERIKEDRLEEYEEEEMKLVEQALDLEN